MQGWMNPQERCKDHHPKQFLLPHSAPDQLAVHCLTKEKLRVPQAPQHEQPHRAPAAALIYQDLKWHVQRLRDVPTWGMGQVPRLCEFSETPVGPSTTRTITFLRLISSSAQTADESSGDQLLGQSRQEKHLNVRVTLLFFFSLYGQG